MKTILKLSIYAIMLATCLNAAEDNADAKRDAFEARYTAQREALREKIARTLPFPTKGALLDYLKTSREQGIARIAIKEVQKALKAANTPDLRTTLKQHQKELSNAKEGSEQALHRIGDATILSKSSIDAFSKAIANEKHDKEDLKAARKALGKINGARGLVGHAKGKWIGGAEKGIAEAETALKKATTDDERKAAQEKLIRMKGSREAGLKALKERQAKLDKVLLEEPALTKAVDDATKELADAKEQALTALANLGLTSVLGDAKLDDQLVMFIVLTEATPKGLAAFASQGKPQEELIEELLNAPRLMKQMVLADSPMKGQYGRAMEIYRTIQKASPRSTKGMFQRLALAIGMQHAMPMAQRNPKTAKDAPTTVDPVKRYLVYEKAYLRDELDPAFADMSTWEYRFIVDGEESDDESNWGRNMLRNYRPDHITNPDYRWRYVGATRTDVQYTLIYRKRPQPELSYFQHIIAHGGICGRRAFFGRFMLRAFGIPTTARPSPGHGALAHWTPDGWVVCLGGGWGVGTTRTRYTRDIDFLATTQARENPHAFMQVKRAQWIGDVFSEDRVFGLNSGDASLWYSVSHYLQRKIIKEAKANVLAAVGEELGEANESKVTYDVTTVEATAEDRTITTTETGVMTIPAVACSSPTKSTTKVIFMLSNLGGKQLHYARLGKPESIEYKITVPKPGSYKLVARIVTTSAKQFLAVSVNNSEESHTIPLPFTIGLWQATDPTVIVLEEGANTLTFSRIGDDIKGLTIKDFVLTPTKIRRGKRTGREPLVD